MNIIAKRFLECWAYDVWVLASITNLDRYYAPTVSVNANGKVLSRKDLEAHCAWCKENEKINSFEIADVLAEGKKIAFRLRYIFTDQNQQIKEGENMVIFHLDDNGKIHAVWVKSSEAFNT